MPIDLAFFGTKIRRYREQFELSLEELSQGTGIPAANLNALELGQTVPTGDQILILADFFRCDYKFFISNERLAPLEQTETLFRRHGDQLSKSDRWAIQEFLFLADAEEFLQESLDRKHSSSFVFTKSGTYLKRQAADAAARLRSFLGYSDSEVSPDVYSDLRRIGLHVFRRRLENSSISGLCMRHPRAGRCILVNYTEDIYRQRFTAAHEAAHAILDDEEEFIVSFVERTSDPREMRANAFASRYLLPPNTLAKLPDPGKWDAEKATYWANTLMVSTAALAFALSEAGLVNAQQRDFILHTRVPRAQKVDPEFPRELSERSTERRRWVIDRGLSVYYVSLCFEAYRQQIITAERLRELLLLSSASELQEIADLYGERFEYAY